MKKRSTKNKPAAHAPLSKDRRIILIDQIPLRKAAEKDALKGLRESAKLRATLEEFERRILPEYQRWEDVHLAPLLQEERAIEAKLQELSQILQQVMFERLFTGCSAAEAFENVMEAKEAAEDSQRRDASDADHDAGIPDFEEDEGLSDEERAFRSYLRFAHGIDPTQLAKSEYRRLFAEFQSKFHMGKSNIPRKALEKDIPARVKELYRILVRRLHPDTGQTQRDPLMERLWHELQDSYEKQDIDRMELLLAMTDLQSGQKGMKSTLFHMRRAAAEFLRAAREMKGQLRKARSTPAWIFYHAPDREKVAASLRRDVATRVSQAQHSLAKMQAQLDSLIKRKSSRSKNGRTSSQVEDQGFFDFI